MGLAESGKTTIVKVVAEGFVPQKKAAYTATIDYKRKSYTMFGKKISLFDLGGQKSFLDRFVGDLAEFIFSNVATFIYVIDLTNVSKMSQSKYYYDLGIKTLKKFSPDANVTILLHKADLIEKDQRQGYIDNIKEFLELDDRYPIFETSIFEKSIFDAMEKTINQISLDPQSVEGIVQKYEKENKEIVDQILLFDDKGNAKISSESDLLDLKEKIHQAQQTLEATYPIQDSIKFSMNQFKEKMTFTAMLKNYHTLLLILNANEPIKIDEEYSKILNNAIRLANDINKFL